MSILPPAPRDPNEDDDPQERAEWQEAFDSVLRAAGPRRVHELMDMLARRASVPSIGWAGPERVV